MLSSQSFSLPQSGDTSKVYRISGFNFTYTGGAGPFLCGRATEGVVPTPFSQFRFDHDKVRGIQAAQSSYLVRIPPRNMSTAWPIITSSPQVARTILSSGLMGLKTRRSQPRH